MMKVALTLQIILVYGLMILSSPLLVLWSLIKSVFLTKKRSFNGKVILVTGAGNGLGREMARQLAKEKCTVLCVDIKPKDLELTLQLIADDPKNKATIKSYICDISDVESVSNLRKTVLKDFQKLDILINNAALLFVAPIEMGEDAAVKRCVDVNILGVTWMVRAFLPTMKKNRSGHIVFINSVGGLSSDKGLALYCMTKAAISSLTWSLISELNGCPEWKDILVSSAHPWFIDSHPAFRKFYRSKFPTLPLGFTASRILHGVQMGHQEFQIPGGELGTRITLIFSRILPPIISRTIKRVFNVEIGYATDYSVYDKIIDPNFSYKDLNEDMAKIEFLSDKQ